MVTIVDSLDACRRLWQALVPAAGLFDLWDVRACFQAHYRYRPRFVVLGDSAAPTGLLALSEIDDHGYWGCFPGETYLGKTWLEQNRIVADTPQMAGVLLDCCRQPVHMRYLRADWAAGSAAGEVDEVGYLFRPAECGYDFERYFNTFSGKSRKKIRRELDGLHERDLRYRHDSVADAFKALEMNLDVFGERSYFADPRFLRSFQDLIRLLAERRWLRVTTVMIGDRAAAIDVAAVYRGVYTVLAGGADPAFPGVAKIINFHHMEWACRRRLSLVDFLCGDFGWKERFHLTPRPLYQVRADGPDVQTAARQAQQLSGVA